MEGEYSFEFLSRMKQLLLNDEKKCSFPGGKAAGAWSSPLTSI
jgi:hypothetical protein